MPSGEGYPNPLGPHVPYPEPMTPLWHLAYGTGGLPMPETPQQPDFEAQAHAAADYIAEACWQGPAFATGDCATYLASLLRDVAAAATARERERWAMALITEAHHEECTCGGSFPGEGCPACRMYHRLRSLGEQP